MEDPPVGASARRALDVTWRAADRLPRARTRPGRVGAAAVATLSIMAWSWAIQAAVRDSFVPDPDSASSGVSGARGASIWSTIAVLRSRSEPAVRQVYARPADRAESGLARPGDGRQ